VDSPPPLPAPPVSYRNACSGKVRRVSRRLVSLSVTFDKETSGLVATVSARTPARAILNGNPAYGLSAAPPSFATSLAATLRSAATATDTGPPHQPQQRIISSVINGDAFGNCYRATLSFSLSHRTRFISSARYLSLARVPDRFSSSSFRSSPSPSCRIPLRNCIPSGVEPRPASAESSRDASLNAESL